MRHLPLPRLTPIPAFCAILALSGMTLGSCAHNTVDSSGDGRLFLMLDLDPGYAAAGTIRINMEVENLDPIALKFWGGDVQPQRVDVSDALPWKFWRSRLYDLTGEFLPGGTEVHFRVDSDKYDSNQISFEMDGNTIIRLVPTDPDRPVGTQHILIELAVQQDAY